ncbi:hypothetical protein Cgig2_007958 [Carnegiea gigantea]|uniref:NB-ARC domain-containing protein n=1 Tax=Carnegiea gigantea TaxID=171969 RepID=A0A9Q1KFR8_9CARY|nr:hypothetical protein Cgig2_007958 [Carnegiea gigantea]
MGQKTDFETTSHIISEKVIGRDLVKGYLIARLLDPSSFVIAIAGIDGIGKTTLAQYICNNKRVKKHFDRLLWVYASRDFTVTKILKDMLVCAGKKIPRDSTKERLQKIFFKNFATKSFLLVLDDISDGDPNQSLRSKWDELRKLTESGSRGSKVLISTLNKSVAIIMACDDPYPLENLNRTDSWLLFKQVAFTGVHQSESEDIGKQIAEMCSRVPLVIHIIAGTLRDKHTVEDWWNFRDEELPTFSRHKKDIKQSLKRSYDQLNPRLKLCFASCSLFSKGVPQLDTHALGLGEFLLFGNIRQVLQLDNVGLEAVPKELQGASLLESL